MGYFLDSINELINLPKRQENERRNKAYERFYKLNNIFKNADVSPFNKHVIIGMKRNYEHYHDSAYLYYDSIDNEFNNYKIFADSSPYYVNHSKGEYEVDLDIIYMFQLIVPQFDPIGRLSWDIRLTKEDVTSLNDSVKKYILKMSIAWESKKIIMTELNIKESSYDECLKYIKELCQVCNSSDNNENISEKKQSYPKNSEQTNSIYKSKVNNVQPNSYFENNSFSNFNTNDAVYTKPTSKVDFSHESQTYYDYGNKAEEHVEYILRWICDPKNRKFRLIERKTRGKFNKKCILLKNKEIIDESQEYDHILISVYGVFCIETKNYSGRIEIDSQGHWQRVDNSGNYKPLSDPIFQLRRHEKLMKSIVGNNIPVISILVIANDNAQISGETNYPVTLIKADWLYDYLDNYDGKCVISTNEINNIYNLIEAHRVYE